MVCGKSQLLNTGAQPQIFLSENLVIFWGAHHKHGEIVFFHSRQPLKRSRKAVSSLYFYKKQKGIYLFALQKDKCQ